MIVRFVITMVAVTIATLVVPGIGLTTARPTSEVAAMVIVAVIFGALNALLRPVFGRFGRTPGGLLVLGIALFVANAAMLLVVSALCGAVHVPWHVSGLGAAALGSVVISIVSFVLNALFATKGEVHE